VPNYNCASAHNVLIKLNSKHRNTVLDRDDRLIDNARAMTILTCDETNSNFDFDSCSYSLERRYFGMGNKYNNYTLGLLCNIQPGKSSICHIYLSIFLLICCAL